MLPKFSGLMVALTLAAALAAASLAQVSRAGDLPAANDAAESPLPDLKIVEVRLVDPGDASESRGPLYRLSLKNESTTAASEFEIELMAGVDFEETDTLVRARATVERIYGGTTRTVDVRLPVEALGLNQAADVDDPSFFALLIVVDAQEEIDEASEFNNRALLAREEIEPVALRLLDVAPRVGGVGETVMWPGEGFGE